MSFRGSSLSQLYRMWTFWKSRSFFGVIMLVLEFRYAGVGILGFYTIATDIENQHWIPRVKVMWESNKQRVVTQKLENLNQDSQGQNHYWGHISHKKKRDITKASKSRKLNLHQLPRLTFSVHIAYWQSQFWHWTVKYLPSHTYLTK